MSEYIITDLTRFNKHDEFCIAVIDRETGQCLRPMPYLKSAKIKELNIHPGAILSGDITIKNSLCTPHIEDSEYNTNLKYLGACSGDEFKTILDKTLSKSVEEGFNIILDDGQKHIPKSTTAKCSIVTIKIEPKLLNIHKDSYNPKRIKASFTDNNFHYFSYLPITDRGFYDYAEKYNTEDNLKKVREFIHSQQEIYLRIGVGREHTIKDKAGYWFQINGIYTFPDFLTEIRSY